MRKSIRAACAVSALTVGVLFAGSGYAANVAVAIAQKCIACGNVVASNNTLNIVNRSFDGNLSHNIVVTGGSVVGGGNSASVSGAVSIVNRSGNSTQTQTQSP